MPQTVNVRMHATLTLAANDLATVNLAGDNRNTVYMKNLGPGKVYVSFDPTVAAAVGNVNCLIMATGDTFTRNDVLRNAAFTLNADTASTILALSASTYP